MKMKFMAAAGLAAVLVILMTRSVPASSHREALAILNEPCADNTGTYAWVTPGSHDKLNLIMNFYPLHEPGQGNQGLRACNGYRYEFHVGIGSSLASRLIYRVEFRFFDGGQAAALAVMVLVSISILYSLVTRALPLERA